MDDRVSLRIVKSKGNSYCGPAVISAITGLPTFRSAALIRKHNPNIKRVRSTYPTALRKALTALQYNVSDWVYPTNDIHDWKTLTTSAIPYNNRVVVPLIQYCKKDRVVAHWLAISGCQYVDGIILIPDFTHNYERQNAKLLGWFVVN